MDLRQLDELIAEKVLGWEKNQIDNFGSDPYIVWMPPNANTWMTSVPFFTTSISDAMRLLESYDCWTINKKVDEYNCIVMDTIFTYSSSVQKTAALAICYAVLQSKQIGVKDVD